MQFNKDTAFAKALKVEILKEFKLQDRKGVYAFTQKSMAYNSNKIEGSTLTSEQTASLFDTGVMTMPANFSYRAKDVEEMTGHFKMFNEVLENLDKPLTIEMIKSFHFQLKSGVFEDYANGYPIGEFKNRANQVADIVTELPQNIPTKMQELIDLYNAGSKELSDIAKFHAEYEKIHPFQDGNGRTGRAIIFKQCLDSNLIPVIISDTDKHIYYSALNAAQTKKDYSRLLEFFKTEQQKYYENVKDFVFLPTKEFLDAQKLMENFYTLLKEESYTNDLKINICAIANSVRLIIQYNESALVIDFIHETIIILNNHDTVSLVNLKTQNTNSYYVFDRIINLLKNNINKEFIEVLDSKNQTSFFG